MQKKRSNKLSRSSTERRGSSSVEVEGVVIGLKVETMRRHAGLLTDRLTDP